MTRSPVSFAGNGDIALRFEAGGDLAAVPIALLHGLGDDRRLWDAMRDHLPAGLRVVAYDLRGHGESSAPQDPGAYGMPAFVADLAAVLDAAACRRAIVAGFSLGGAVALHFALAHPERTLAVAAINANAAARDPAEEAALVAAAEEGADRPLAGRERRWAERLVARLAPGARLAAAVGRRASIVERAHDIAVPVLLVASDRDPGFARRSAALLPRLRAGRRVLVEGAGHAAMLDRPAEVARALSAFALEIGAAAGRPSPPR